MIYAAHAEVRPGMLIQNMFDKSFSCIVSVIQNDYPGPVSMYDMIMITQKGIKHYIDDSYMFFHTYRIIER